MHWPVDHSLIHLVLWLSSSEDARLAAAAWLTAFEAARGSGAGEDQAHSAAGQAWRSAMSQFAGQSTGRPSGMLPVHTWIDARPPPLQTG